MGTVALLMLAGSSGMFAAEEKSGQIEEIKEEVGKLNETYDRVASEIAKLEEAKDIPREAANLEQLTKTYLDANAPGSQNVGARGLFKALDEGENRLKKSIAQLEKKFAEPGLDPDLRKSISEFAETPRKSLAELIILRKQALTRREAISDFKNFCAQLIDVYEKLQNVDEDMAKEKIRSAVKKKLQAIKSGSVTPQADIKFEVKGTVKLDVGDEKKNANIEPNRSEKKSSEVAVPARKSVPGVYEISDLDTAPVCKFQARPQYPIEARKSGLTGEVVIDCLIDAKGEVSNAEVFRSSQKVFEAAALAAIRKWKFRPGRKGDQNVITHLNITIAFSHTETI
jgi:TonB family protein